MVGVEMDRVCPDRGGDEPEACDPFGGDEENACTCDACDACLECPVVSSRSNSFNDCSGGEIRIPDWDSFRLSLLNTRLRPFGEDVVSGGNCGEEIGIKVDGVCAKGCGGGSENCACVMTMSSDGNPDINRKALTSSSSNLFSSTTFL
jgi:hypothetical protein